MANTTNYNWETPDDTDLVKDGAAAIRTLGNSVDTTTKALNPSTTLGDIEYRSSTSNTNARLGIGSAGQVLTVASGVPSWATPTTGDIEGVTAGTGISGGGTSGTVTITNDMATTITASGDIVLGTGSGTYDNLPIGSTGQVLTADTTVSPYKVKWATPASGGGYTQLATGSLTGSSITISSISASYQDLVLVLLDFYASSDAYIQMKFNNAGNSYSDTGRVDNVALTSADFTIAAIGDNTDGDNFCWALIPAYSTTTSNKMVQSISVTKNQTTGTNNNIWPSWAAQKLTAAINRIDILPTAGTFSAGTYTLYGVK